MNPYDEITKLLSDVDYQLIEHEHVITSDDAARVRGLSKSEGMKSLVLRADDKLILVVVRADNKLHSKKVRHHFGVREVRFATPEQVLETMGVEVGACYPFGAVPGIEMIIDETLAHNEFVSFNPGIHTKTIRMKWQDYERAVKPTLVGVIKTN